MGDLVNLRRARKDRARADKETAAQANRIAFGRTKVERELTGAERDLAARRLEGHRREVSANPPAGDDER